MTTYNLYAIRGSADTTADVAVLAEDIEDAIDAYQVEYSTSTVLAAKQMYAAVVIPTELIPVQEG